MKAHITEAQLVMAAPQLVLPIRAQRNCGVIAPDRVFPEVRERRCGLRKLARKIRHRSSFFGVSLSEALIWLLRGERAITVAGDWCRVLTARNVRLRSSCAAALTQLGLVPQFGFLD